MSIRVLSLLCSILLSVSAFAQLPPTRISDEGGAKSVFFNLDCVGGGISCSTSGINATVNVPTGYTSSDFDADYAAELDVVHTWTALQDYKSGIRFSDDSKAIFGSGDDATISYDGTNLVIRPDAVGTGIVQVGLNGLSDLMVDDVGLCGTAIGATSVMTGNCSGTKRGVLSFTFTKSGGTGLAANIASTLIYSNLLVNANASGFSSNMTIETFGTGTNNYNHFLAASALPAVSLTAGTHRFRGIYLTAPTPAVSATGATIYQIGLHQKRMTAMPGATLEQRIGAMFEDDVVISNTARLIFEAANSDSPTPGDSYWDWDNTNTELELWVDGVEAFVFDNDLHSTTVPTQFENIGLAGTTPISNAGITMSGTHSDFIGPLLSNFTYNGTDFLVAALQSEVTYAGSGVSPITWGIKAASLATSASAGLFYNYGIQAEVGFSDASQVLSAGEIGVFIGVNGGIRSSGGSHDPSSWYIAIGNFIPAFPAVTGPGVLVERGIYSEETIEVASNVRYGYNASLLGAATTYQVFDSVNSELQTIISGTEIQALKTNAISWFGVAPATRPAAYTITNGLSDRSYDANATSTAELADVLYTLIEDLKLYGLLQ